MGSIWGPLILGIYPFELSTIFRLGGLGVGSHNGVQGLWQVYGLGFQGLGFRVKGAIPLKSFAQQFLSIGILGKSEQK